MKCSKCENLAIYEHPALCKEHFNDYFEKKVLETIKEYDLLSKKDKICVAASGGKDSVSLLYVLHKYGYFVEALAIDEGIAGYRDDSLEFLKKFCSEKNIVLRIFSYKDEIGSTIDILSKKYSPACNVCGTFRRHLLEKHSKGYDKIVTGHNLDDESQAVLMNILKAQTSLFARQGPKTSSVKGFTQKVKPFYFIKEKDVMIYAYLNGLNVDFQECPYAPQSFRAHVRDLLNEYEAKNPGAKMNIILHYLKFRNIKTEPEEIKTCLKCGLPSSGNICKACRIKAEIKR